MPTLHAGYHQFQVRSGQAEQKSPPGSRHHFNWSRPSMAQTGNSRHENRETNSFKIYSKAKYLMSCPPKQQYMALQTNSRQICKHESFIQLSKTSFKMVDRVERNVEAYTLKFNSVQKNVNTNSLIITITNCAQYFCAALLAQKHTNSNYIGIN